MDWKKVIGAIAPGLATALGGPLAGAAVGVLAEKVLGGSSGDPVTDEAKLAGILSGGMTPELQAKVIEAETALKLEAMRMGLEEKKLDAATDHAYLNDVSDARKNTSMDKDVLGLGIAVLIVWGVLTAGTLLGLYKVLIGGIEIEDIGIAATVFTVLGSIIGYVSNSAQQVLGYYFGSSRGSNQKTAAMAEAISNIRK